MIGRYESGGSGPELDVLIQLAVVLDKHEFRIGDHLVIIKAADEAEEKTPSQPKQLRLRHGEEYVFDGRGGASMKIQPSREDLFITHTQRSR